jgi:trk system potassium uptake protein TrkA
MRILIVGANRLGRAVAAELRQDGHDVRMLDTRAKRLAVLEEELRRNAVHGSALDRGTLEPALAGCDALVALTGSDVLNVVVALAGRRELRVPLAIAVVGNAARAAALGGLGVHVVCPTTRTARDLHHAVARSGVESELPLGGDIRVYRAELPPRLAGRTLRELERPGELLAIALERDGRVLLAVPRLTVTGGDVLHVAAVHHEHVVDLTRP